MDTYVCDKPWAVPWGLDQTAEDSGDRLALC